MLWMRCVHLLQGLTHTFLRGYRPLSRVNSREKSYAVRRASQQYQCYPATQLRFFEENFVSRVKLPFKCTIVWRLKLNVRLRIEEYHVSCLDQYYLSESDTCLIFIIINVLISLQTQSIEIQSEKSDVSYLIQSVRAYNHAQITQRNQMCIYNEDQCTHIRTYAHTYIKVLYVVYKIYNSRR